MKAIPYVRFSSAKQAQGSSAARQQEAIGRWLLANPEYTLSNLRFEDLGKSGWSGEHLEHGFGQLLAAIEHNEIKAGDVILIEALDRAGRLPAMEMLPLLSKIVNSGVNIVTLDDSIIYDKESANSNHLFLLVAKVQQANQYSDTLSRRVKASYKARRQKAAAGVSIKRSTPVWIDKENQLIPELAPLIQQAFEDFASGLGERRIYDRIKDKHPALAKLNPSTIKRWMGNRTAIGYWGDIADAHPPVVSKELYYRVQRRLEGITRTTAAPKKHLLAGLVKCGACGGGFVYKKLSKAPHCMGCGRRSRLGDDGCSNKTNIPVQLIEYIRALTYASALQRAFAGQRASSSEKIQIELEGEIAEVSRNINRLAGLIARFDSPEIEEQLEAATERRASLQAQLANLVALPDTDDFSDILWEGEDMLDDDPAKLNALLQQANYQIICNGRTITVNEQVYGQGPDVQVIEYQGSKRTPEGGEYHWKWNGEGQREAIYRPMTEEEHAQWLSEQERAENNVIYMYVPKD